MLAANGGAGGIGCRDNLTGTGAAGEDGRPINVIARSVMATSCTDGALGGDGGAQTDTPPTPAIAPAVGASSPFSGGGGGGGGGYIVIWAAQGGYPVNPPGFRTPVESRVTAVE